MTKTQIKGMNQEELALWLQALGEKTFRSKQIYQWIYKHGVRTFEEMSNIAKPFREKLNELAEISLVSEHLVAASEADSTKKYLFRLNDGHMIESVYMPEEKKATLCISTMVGCPVGCPYCATGLMGFVRKLSAGEIMDQFLYIQKNNDVPITNIVFMGMGEPFFNYENSIRAAQLLNSEAGPEISARKITISTSGVIPAIERYAAEGHKFKLAVSLNGTTDMQRDELIPLNKKYPLQPLLDACRTYTAISSQRITFEYILIRDFNDSDEDARRLVQLLSRIPCKLNIIPFNENSHVSYKSPSEATLEHFLNLIYQAPFAVTVRRSKGRDIAAACGQLYADNKKSA